MVFGSHRRDLMPVDCPKMSQLGICANPASRTSRKRLVARSRAFALLASLQVCWVGSAVAQTAPAAAGVAAPQPPQAPTLVAPHLLDHAPVDYPKEASGDAVVLLVVTVNADGSVRDASATEEHAPFSELAEQQVKGWRFEPATRDGVPVAAKVRLELAFRAPVLVPAEPIDEPAAVTTPNHPTTPGAAPKPEQETIDVTVVGERRPPMVTTLSRAEVRQIPGTFGDPFRALELLPGVTPIISGLPYFYVRGAPPGNVGYYVDGIRVPYLYHVAIGPSVVHPGMIESVDLYSGGYPAPYGRFAGGVVSAQTTAPRTTLHGEGNVRLYDAGAMVEGGFANGRGTVLLGGRYSYTAALLSLAVKGLQLDYRDYQARVTYDVTPNDRISALGFGAYDLLAQEKNGISTIGFGSEFYRGQLRWDHRLASGGQVRTSMTLGYDQTSIGGQRNAQDRMLAVRSELDQPLNSYLRFRVGIDTMRDGYRVTKPVYDDPDNPQSQRFQDTFPSRTDMVTGLYSDIAIEVQKGFTVTPGLRLDYYKSGDATALGVDPRLSARMKVREGLAIVHSYGIAHQPPSFILPVPGLALGSLAEGLQTSYQTSAGIEWAALEGTTVTANVFNNIFQNMTDALSIPESPGNSISQRTTGRAYGAELFIHRKMTQRIGGILSYTLSRSTRRLGDSVFPAAFDRRHVLNAALAYNLGRNWRAGTRLVFYTGAPVRSTPATGSTSSETPTATPTTTRTIANPDPPRDPAFYRIDLRLEKLWQYSETRHLSFVAEVLNATLRKEIYNGSALGPIFVPSLGLEGAF